MKTRFSGILIAFFLINLLTGNRCNEQGPKESTRNNPDPVIKESKITDRPLPKYISLCTFNIQFLGSFQKKDNEAIAFILKNYNIIVIQELVAPPVDSIYPDGTNYKADPESKSFVDEMLKNGFRFLISEEDTGTGDHIHSPGTGTEWFICFYDTSAVNFDPALPHGFLAEDRSNNNDYERVPYAFPFKMRNGKNDFVLISVHLKPGEDQSSRARRKHEINSIYQWILANNHEEKDFIILGDMNIGDKQELHYFIPASMKSLNDECRPTNTLINNKPPNYGAKPYDHVIYFMPHTSTDIDTAFDCQVLDLKKILEPLWKGPGVYPGNPYNHNLFRQYYSDHNPLVFRLNILQQDED